MRSFVLAAAVLCALAAPVLARHGKGHPRRGHTRASCDADRCAVATALDAVCPCADAANHGQYVRCVAHAVKAMATSGEIGRRCRGHVVAEAAHSVCGHLSAVTCLVPTSTCSADGTCTNDPSTACVDDTDCGTRCTVTSSDACDNANGLPSDAPSCGLVVCFSPSGAFLDLVH
ncbi:MAG TPA: hypothetical protein VKW76_08190 [Candidatus Binatia bacterium]|nr:hypothetical protein [Candidatus Binatia bacterium]